MRFAKCKHTASSEGFQLILSMGLKFQIPIVEHLITGWGTKKGRKHKPTDVMFLLIYHLSYNTNNRR